MLKAIVKQASRMAGEVYDAEATNGAKAKANMN